MTILILLYSKIYFNHSLLIGTNYQNTETIKGPIHTFNGHEANFYMGMNEGSCSVFPSYYNRQSEANYFCQSFYGKEWVPISYTEGYYSQSGSMGYQMHRSTCTSGGETIDGTWCSDRKCRIYRYTSNRFGLYNIICKKLQTGK